MNARRIFFTALLAAGLTACGDDETRVINNGGTGTGGTSTDPTAFNFRTESLDAFNVDDPLGGKLDRMGGPATITALLRPGPTGGALRQAANETEPADDAQYASEYIAQLRRYHFHLAPALAGLGLDTCATVGATVDTTDVGQCVTQALANPVIPDVLRLNTSVASDYPNGRKPDDPVVDVLLAIALLDLGGPGGAGTCLGVPCTQRTLEQLPLNVNISSPPSLPSFPYLNNQQLNPPPPADP